LFISTHKIDIHTNESLYIMNNGT